jgi:hypothetical protein
MDPVSITGLAASILTIIEITKKIFKTLQKFRERWKETDLEVLLLETQVTTLEAALDQIHKWISSNLDSKPCDYQLYMTLESSLRSCQLLISHLDHYTSTLDRREDDTLDWRNKLAVVSENPDLKRYLELLNNQTSALNLLLTALSWFVAALTMRRRST